jgi:mRNA interferase MazF
MHIEIYRFEIWLANLNPTKGNEPGKVRPVVVIQSNILNEKNPTTIICPITSKIIRDVNILRINLEDNQLDKPCAILVDQIRAIDNQRFISKIGELTTEQAERLNRNLIHILDLKI